MTRQAPRPDHRRPRSRRGFGDRRKLAIAAAGAVAAVSAAAAVVVAWPDSSAPSLDSNPGPGAVHAAPATLLSNPKAADRAGRPIPGSYLVRFEKRAGLRSPRQITKAANRLTTQVGGDVTYVYTAALHGFAVKMSAQQAKAMSGKPGVAKVSQDVVVAGLATDPVSQPAPPWHLDRIDQPNLPLSGTYDYDDNGAGANIFVLDTGVRTTNQEFGGRAKGSGPTPEDSKDCEGHGTAVAGTAAGTTYGVAKKASINAIRVLGCDTSGPMTSGLQAIDWITKNALRPAVVNLSWGTSPQDELDNAIRASIASGVTYVIAAGNSDTDACDGSPARVREAIVVGASDQNDNRSSYSSYGSCVDLFAPGNDIATSSWEGDNATTSASGTSLAAPVVTGAVAVYLSEHPSATPAQVSTALSKCAESGILGDPGPGSPNLLLNSRCGASGVALTSPGRQTTSIGQKVTLPAIKATGANGDVRFTATGLPDGLAIDATTGKISGAAGSTAKSSTVTVRATNSSGTTSETFTWDIIVGIGPITGVGGNCVDSNSSGTAEGNKIQLWECNQDWMAATDGTVSFYDRDLTKCMSASVAESSDGTAIVISACDGGDDEVWKPAADGTLVNPATGQCLTAPKTDWGTQLTLAPCSGAAGQQWKLPSGVPDSASISVPGNQVTARGAATSLRAHATSTNTTTTFTYAASGLPNGMSINENTGLITGSPTSHQATSPVTVTATGSSGVTASAGFTWKVADGHITGPASWCADDYYGKADKGNPIMVWGCNDGGTQLWTAGEGGTFEVAGACMTADGAKAGALIGMDDCSKATAWTQKGNTVIDSASGLCLNAPVLDYEKQLTLAACDGSTGQQWYLPVTSGEQPTPSPSTTATPEPTGTPAPTPTGTPTGGPTTTQSPTPTGSADPGSSSTPTPTSTGPDGVTGQIAHPSGSWCADVRDVVGLWDCNHTGPQTFTYRASGQLIQNVACMTPASDNTRVIMTACDSTNGAQVWKQKTDGTVLNPASGLCLTASDFGYTQPFELAACTGDTQQLWTLPVA